MRPKSPGQASGCNPGILSIQDSGDTWFERKETPPVPGEIALPVPVDVASIPHVQQFALTKDHHQVRHDPGLFRVFVLDQESLHFVLGVEVVIKIVVDDDDIVKTVVALGKDVVGHSQDPCVARGVGSGNVLWKAGGVAFFMVAFEKVESGVFVFVFVGGGNFWGR